MQVYNFVIIPSNGVIKYISLKSLQLSRLQCTNEVQNVSSGNTLCNRLSRHIDTCVVCYFDKSLLFFIIILLPDISFMPHDLFLFS